VGLGKNPVLLKKKAERIGKKGKFGLRLEIETSYIRRKEENNCIVNGSLGLRRQGQKRKSEAGGKEIAHDNKLKKKQKNMV